MVWQGLVASIPVGTSARTLCLALLIGAACGSGNKNSQAPAPASLRRPVSNPEAATEPPGLVAAELGRVPDITYGPYLGLGSNGALVVWAAQREGKRFFSAVALSAEGRPEGPIREVAPAPETLGLVAVRAVKQGYLLAHTGASGASELLSVLCLDAGGRTSKSIGPMKLSGAVLWIEAVPAPDGAMVFYAAEPDPGERRAEVGAFTVNTDCTASPPRILARNVLAWQALASDPGAVLAVTRRSSGDRAQVEALRIDQHAQLLTTTRVTEATRVGLDLDAARIGDAVVLAWTDRIGFEPRLMGAAIDSAGRLQEPPQSLTPAQGEQALIRIVPPASAGGDGFLAWENLSSSPLEPERIVHLSRLDANAKLTGPRARLRYQGDLGSVPELCATSRGLAALTTASLCFGNRPCDTAIRGPIFVELNRDLEPIATEPLRLEPLKRAWAELGFGLGCTREGCFAIAAQNQTPSPIFAVQLETRPSSFAPPIWRIDPALRPRVASHETLCRAPSVAAFARGRSGDTDYLATVSNFDSTTPWKRLKSPAPDGRLDPLRARLNLERVLPDPGIPQSAPASPISLRAHSFGGVALAAAGSDPRELLVAWAGIELGIPQVFLTLVDRTGKRVLQRMLTRKQGDLGEIAAAWVPNGWVVAWVDDRFGDREVFAAKLDERLNRVAPEQRITDSPGAAADPALAFDGRTLGLVWSEARQAEQAGHSEIFGVELSVQDAKPIGIELRLSKTPAHSFSPSLQHTSDGIVVAWGEKGDRGGAPGAIAILRTEALALPSAPLKLTLPKDAEPRSVGLSCAEDSCRLGAIFERDGRATLAATSWSGPADPAPLREILGLSGTSGSLVPPVLSGDELWFVDASAEQASVRRARLEW